MVNPVATSLRYLVIIPAADHDTMDTLTILVYFGYQLPTNVTTLGQRHSPFHFIHSVMDVVVPSDNCVMFGTNFEFLSKNFEVLSTYTHMECLILFIFIIFNINFVLFFSIYYYYCYYYWILLNFVSFEQRLWMLVKKFVIIKGLYQCERWKFG